MTPLDLASNRSTRFSLRRQLRLVTWLRREAERADDDDAPTITAVADELEYLANEVETLRAELAWVRSVVTLHQQNGCGVDLVRIGEAMGGDRPPYPTLELERLRADRDRWKAANEAALAHNEEYGSELERLRAAVDLHHEDRVDSVIASWCVECEKPWPCPTVVTGGGDA